MDWRSRTKQTLHRFGYDIHKRDPDCRHDMRSLAGKRLMTYLPALDVQHVIDVGANVGQFARMVRREGLFTGRIDSFEPVRQTYDQLKQEFAGDENWFGHQVALSSEAGSATMNLYPSSVFNAISVISDLGQQVFGYNEDTRVTTEQVRMITLDEADIPRLDRVFLKIDAQGHDWPVLEGAQQVLDRVILLSVELSFVKLYEEYIPAWDVLARLNDMGFGLGFLDDTVCPADDPLRLGSADAYFVRKVR
jgi:FkbM family methyltransferase